MDELCLLFRDLLFLRVPPPTDRFVLFLIPLNDFFLQPYPPFNVFDVI